jgi:arginine decarboxylase
VDSRCGAAHRAAAKVSSAETGHVSLSGARRARAGHPFLLSCIVLGNSTRVASDPKIISNSGPGNGTIRKYNPAQPWQVEDSQELYLVNAWGKGYFSINDAGHVVVRPDTQTGNEIDLYDVVEGLKARDLTTPVVVRFSDILAHRLKHMAAAFSQAIAENDYKNRYAAVFPIKVNQQRLVVEEVYRYGREFGFGLEAGSKPELLAVMAMTENSSDRLIVCNGFKDDSYIEAVTLATKLGRTIIPVVENFDELGLILKHAQSYGVRPRIGVRVKLFSEGSGRWRDSAGEKSKFGLFVTEILELFNILKSHDMLDCLQLVHCHPGSQLQDIRRVKDAINELAHVYAELKLMGAGLQYIDVGGGLGVDYDGSGTNFSSSMNYTLNEYASDVVYRIASVCNARDIPHPMIISESGRAVAAYHSVLIFDALGSSALDKFQVTGNEVNDYRGDKELPAPVQDLSVAYRSVSERRLVECYHDALTAREQVLQMFNIGLLSLEFRALAERLYWATLARIRDAGRKLERMPEELEDLEVILSDTYFCNFSVFQSLPDSWAIDQLFPIMPVHRLDERPTRTGVLADITCDSDGKIDRFVSLRDVKRTLELHELRDGEKYYLAAFLVGAYQETLGDLHNLFGDTHVVHIRLHDEGGWWIEEIVKGDTANKVLEYMEYDVAELAPALSRDCERAIRAGRMTIAETQKLKRFYEGELDGYSYLEPAGP